MTTAALPRAGEILVIHEDAVIVDLIVNVLRAEGYEVKGTTQARTALEMIDASRPILVIIQHAMPEMNGPEMIMHLRFNEVSSPVILVAPSRREVKPFLRPRQVLYLRQPIRRHQLLECVARCAAPTQLSEPVQSGPSGSGTAKLPTKPVARKPTASVQASTPTCTLCGGTTFRPQSYSALGAGTVRLLCCVQCGGVVGVLGPPIDDDLYRIQNELRQLCQRFDALAGQLGRDLND